MERSLSLQASCQGLLQALERRFVDGGAFAVLRALERRQVQMHAEDRVARSARREASRRYSVEELLCSSFWLGELFASFSNMDPTSFSM